jgi:hypothetical protein
LGIVFIIDCTALVLLTEAERAVRDSARGATASIPTLVPPDIPGWRTYTNIAGTFALHYPAHRFELTSEDETGVSFRSEGVRLSVGLYDNVCQMGTVGPAEVLDCLARNAAALAEFDAAGLSLVHKRLWRGDELNGYEVEFLATSQGANLRVTGLYVRWDAYTMVGAHLARPDSRSSQVARREERRLLESLISSVRVYRP